MERFTSFNGAFSKLRAHGTGELMTLSQLTIITAIGLVILIGRPDKLFDQINELRQEEEFQEEIEILAPDEIRITFHATTAEEEEIADIMWLKKAAEATLNKGYSYFNIVDQEISREFFSEHNMLLSEIDGIIRMEEDPMTAEYNAHDISNLALGRDYSL
jgi:hypothetical protein